MKTKFKILLLTISLIGIGITTFALTDNDTCAKCSGAKICNACSNCNYCKNCSQNGGVCGVCSPESFEVKKKAKTKAVVKKKPVKK